MVPATLIINIESIIRLILIHQRAGGGTWKNNYIELVWFSGSQARS